MPLGSLYVLPINFKAFASQTQKLQKLQAFALAAICDQGQMKQERNVPMILYQSLHGVLVAYLLSRPRVPGSNPGAADFFSFLFFSTFNLDAMPLMSRNQSHCLQEAMTLNSRGNLPVIICTEALRLISRGKISISAGVMQI